ncbi:hypothetical protein NC651_036773 [Populus alba x Populus x berolinensis]|nr:hypothetical protein NC651_036773 [Populus alba x Populus x berolinensis]
MAEADGFILSLAPRQELDVGPRKVYGPQKKKKKIEKELHSWMFMRCHVIGHSANACNKGPKKWPHTASAGPDFGSPFEEIVAMEKQQPYSATPLVDPPVDPICIRS